MLKFFSIVASLLPPGTRYCSFTVDEEDGHLEPAIIQGAMFDVASGMEKTLGALISNAVWNKHWAFSQLDRDRFISIIQFLCWQVIMPQEQKPFHGRKLYALLYIASYAGVLGSSNFGSDSDVPDPVMSEMATLLIKQLSREDADDFIHFCEQYTFFHQTEYDRYVEGEKEAASIRASSSQSRKGKDVVQPPLSIPFVRDDSSSEVEEDAPIARNFHDPAEDMELDDEEAKEQDDSDDDEDDDVDEYEGGEEGEDMDTDSD